MAHVPSARCAPPDTLRASVSAGARTEWSNELFFEDQSLIDTTLDQRNLVDSPEAWTLGALDAALIGTRARGETRYRAQNELLAGPRLLRDIVSLSWQQQVGPTWRFQLAPQGEYEHDQRFGRDVEEARASTLGRLGRALGLDTRLELHALGDVTRTRGHGSEYMPDRNAVEAGLALERYPLDGAEWRLGYRYAQRAYPDSTTRDHIEHGVDGEWRRDLAGSGVYAQARATRRDALHPVDTRDQFLEADGAAGLRIWMGPSLDVEMSAGLETLTFDDPDTVVYFDYRIYRAALLPRISVGPWSFTIGPRAEVLTSDQSAFEEYTEGAVVLGVELLQHRSWWNFTPALGWRDYRDPTDDGEDSNILHTSFTYLDLTAYGDQPLPGALRARLMASARSEWHADPASNVHSLYFSLDVRRLF